MRASFLINSPAREIRGGLLFGIIPVDAKLEIYAIIERIRQAYRYEGIPNLPQKLSQVNDYYEAVSTDVVGDTFEKFIKRVSTELTGMPDADVRAFVENFDSEDAPPPFPHLLFPEGLARDLGDS